MFGKLSGRFSDFFGASPGPGVAGNGFSAKNDSQFRGRHSNPCPGDPFRGHFSFLKVTPKKWQTFMFIWFVFHKEREGREGQRKTNTKKNGA